MISGLSRTRLAASTAVESGTRVPTESLMRISEMPCWRHRSICVLRCSYFCSSTVMLNALRRLDRSFPTPIDRSLSATRSKSRFSESISIIPMLT
ncbi:Uncharacterised protein [Mycobacteroides abscessus subsp. abscessus]|nr:Uncharacterised protein [Mycobacteroides abscessus subsp. abscessus]